MRGIRGTEEAGVEVVLLSRPLRRLNGVDFLVDAVQLGVFLVKLLECWEEIVLLHFEESPARYAEEN